MARNITKEEMDALMANYKTVNKGKYMLIRHILDTRYDETVYVDGVGGREVYKFEVLTAPNDKGGTSSAAALCYTDNADHAKYFNDRPMRINSGGYSVMVWDEEKGEYAPY